MRVCVCACVCEREENDCGCIKMASTECMRRKEPFANNEDVTNGRFGKGSVLCFSFVLCCAAVFICGFCGDVRTLHILGAFQQSLVSFVERKRGENRGEKREEVRGEEKIRGRKKREEKRGSGVLVFSFSIILLSFLTFTLLTIK